jgi:hypothetical protein
MPPCLFGSTEATKYTQIVTLANTGVNSPNISIGSHPHRPFRVPVTTGRPRAGRLGICILLFDEFAKDVLETFDHLASPSE